MVNAGISLPAPAGHLALARQVLRLQRPTPGLDVLSVPVEDTPEEHEWLDDREAHVFIADASEFQDLQAALNTLTS